MKKNFLLRKSMIIIYLLSLSATSQSLENKTSTGKMKVAIKEFFIKNGEIDKQNGLDIEARELLDGSDIGSKAKGIYLIRTVYRTDGTDYLFFKNGEDFEIVALNDLKIILNKSILLFKDESDSTLMEYIPELIKWYKDDKTAHTRKTKFLK
ncbi:hypothetical protein ASE21_16295 [Flavobacterium sp. Root901]|uniref:hypothetical protein n=1 Tax=Flavobacterium sp. Root901 TaxID=1736605 RepID=UPI00070DEBE9|nr:hypothetical protein [Flavobacterium sp. Root901]KRD08248.1 hypothetical protein ASE21_16295 [Flavobacterium sp. Root901]